MNNFSSRCEAVGGARRIADNVMICRIVFVIIDAEHDGDVFIFCRCADDNFLCACGDVFRSTSMVTENACTFDYDINTEIAPAKFFWITF